MVFVGSQGGVMAGVCAGSITPGSVPSETVLELLVQSVVSWSRCRLPIPEPNGFGVRQTIFDRFLSQASPVDLLNQPKLAYHLTHTNALRFYRWYLTEANPAFDIRRVKTLKLALQSAHMIAMFGHENAARNIQRALVLNGSPDFTITGRFDKPTSDRIQLDDPKTLTGRVFTHWLLSIDTWIATNSDYEVLRLGYLQRAIGVSYGEIEIG